MGWVGWKEIPRTGPIREYVWYFSTLSRIVEGERGLTVVLVITVDQSSHLVVPELDGSIVQSRGEKRLLRV